MRHRLLLMADPLCQWDNGRGTMKLSINAGIMLMLAVAVFQSLMSAIVKGIAPSITTGIQVLFYYGVPLSVIVLMSFRGQWRSYATPLIWVHFLRGVFAASAVFCFFYASRNMSLGVAAVMFNTSPAFVPLFAGILLREWASKQVLLGIVFSLIGVVVVIHPQPGQFLTPVSFIGLASGVLMAISQVQLRYLTIRKESKECIVFFLYLFCALISSLIILFEVMSHGHSVLQLKSNGHMISITAWLLLLGIISLIAQRTLTRAFIYMPAAQLVPFLYVSIPVSSIIGWVLWLQQLSVPFFVGASLILAGILMISFDNKKEIQCDPGYLTVEEK